MNSFPQFGLIDGQQFNYVLAQAPTVTINPRALYATWLNSLTGEIFVCTDNATNANIWHGQMGTDVP